MHLWHALPEWAHSLAIALACFGAFLTLLFIVAMFEQRLRRPYISADVPPDSFPPYLRQMVVDLDAQGFEYGGTLVHGKYPKVEMTGTVWYSPDRQIVALSASGKVFGSPRKQTWLYTPLADGRFLMTTDQNDEGDPAGVFLARRKLNTLLPALLSLHRKRIDHAAHNARRFTEDLPLDALTHLYDQRVTRLIERGRGAWVDAEQTRWHYTSRGAALVCLNFFVQLGGALPQFWRVKSEGAGRAT